MSLIINGRKLTFLIFALLGSVLFLLLLPKGVQAARGDIHSLGAGNYFGNYPAAAGKPIATCSGDSFYGYVLDSNGNVWEYNKDAPGSNKWGYYQKPVSAVPLPGISPTNVPVDITCDAFWMSSLFSIGQPVVVTSTGDLYRLKTGAFGGPGPFAWSAKLNNNHLSDVIALKYPADFMVEALTANGDVYKIKFGGLIVSSNWGRVNNVSDSFRNLGSGKPVDIGKDFNSGDGGTDMIMVLADNGDIYTLGGGTWNKVNVAGSFPKIAGGGKPIAIDGRYVLDSLGNFYRFDFPWPWSSELSYQWVGVLPKPHADFAMFELGTEFGPELGYYAVESGPACNIDITPNPGRVAPGALFDHYDVGVIIKGAGGTMNLYHNNNDSDPTNDLSASHISFKWVDPSTGKPATLPRSLVDGAQDLISLEAQTQATTLIGDYTIKVSGTVTITGGEYDGQTIACEDQAGLTVFVPPWLKTTGGDVGSLGAISPIQRVLPAGESNADYLVISQGAIDANFKSAKQWLVGSYSSLNIYPKPNPTMYDTLWDKFGKISPNWNGKTDINFSGSASEVYYTDSSFTLATCSGFSGNAVFFVGGDLTINTDMGCNVGRIVFVVKGNLAGFNGISVGPGVTVLNGYFITNGNFSDGSSANRLTINGGLVAGLVSPSSVSFSRDLGATNSNTPAERIDFDPAYLWYFRDLIGDTKVIYREVAP